MFLKTCSSILIFVIIAMTGSLTLHAKEKPYEEKPIWYLYALKERDLVTYPEKVLNIIDLKPGDHMSIGGYRLVFDDLDASHGSNFTTVTANLSVYRSDQEKGQNGAFITKLKPSKAYYHKSNKPTSEVDIKRTLGGDLYTAIEDVDNIRNIVRVKVLIKPLINWIWIGSTISMLGTIMVLTSFYIRRSNIVEIENARV